MDKKSLVILLIFFVVFGFIFHNNRNQDDYHFNEETPPIGIVKSEQTIKANYQYRNNEHRLAGVLYLPTPCHSYDIEIKKSENVSEIRIAIVESDEICIQVISESVFDISFFGDPDDLILASINGEFVNLDIFEISPEQDILDFENNPN